MKDFLKLIFAFSLCYLLAICLLRILWIQAVPITIQKDIIRSDVHTVVIGASNGQFSWDDRIIQGTLNLCDASLSYAGAFNNLRWAIEYNENKIDTVILCASMVSMAYITDNDLQGQLDGCREERRNIFNYSNFFLQYRKYSWFWKYLFTRFPVKNFKSLFTIDGRYVELERNEIGNSQIYSKINTIIDMYPEGLTKDFFKNNCTYQLDNLCRIHKYCKDKELSLIILSPPVYKIPEMINDKGYRDIIIEELGDSILVSDYCRFAFPDSTYYGDLEHLNRKGADYFSKTIADEGLQTQYAIDWRRNGE